MDFSLLLHKDKFAFQQHLTLYFFIKAAISIQSFPTEGGLPGSSQIMACLIFFIKSHLMPLK